MGRDMRGPYDGYDGYDGYDERDRYSRPPSSRGERPGDGRPPASRGRMMPPERPSPAQPSPSRARSREGEREARPQPESRGMRRPATSDAGAGGDEMMARRPYAPGRAGNTPQRGPARDAEPPSRSARGARPPSDGRGYPPEREDRGASPPMPPMPRRPERAEYAGYEAPPALEREARGGRRSMRQMAADASRSMSRSFSMMMRSTGKALRREVASAAQAGRAPAPSAGRPPVAPSPGMSVDAATPQRYRRSRIRMRARKWRTGRVRANPIGYAITFGLVTAIVVMTFGAGGAGTVYAVNYYGAHRAEIQNIANLRNAQNTEIFDRNGKLLYTVKSDSSFNYYVPLSQISPILQQATIDTEDHTFYQNVGVDFQGTLRALTVDLAHGGAASQGGSTITQQLVKRIVIDNSSKTLTRKLDEAILAYGVTENYDKSQILEMYLNTIDYGDQNEGIEAAARNYFGLKPKPGPNGIIITANEQLTLAQAALLAGLPNAPTYYLPTMYSCDKAPCLDKQWDNPCTNSPLDGVCTPNPNYDYQKNGHEWLDWRRARVVLDSMLKYGDITQQQHDTALQQIHDMFVNETIQDWRFQPASSNDTAQGNTKLAPSFVDYILAELTDDFHVAHPETAGLRVYTTLDYNLEQAAEGYVDYYINKPYTLAWPTYCNGNCNKAPLSAPIADGGANAHDAAVLAMDPRDGDILAMVGTAKYGDMDPRVGGYNNLTTAARSLGSSEKGLVYATALQMGWDPGIMMQDKPICFPDGGPTDPSVPNCKGHYTPHNFDPLSYSGPAQLRLALANSLNIPATEALSFVGGTPDTADAFLAMAQRLGVTTLKKGAMGPTTALGAQDVPLLELTNAYGTFANGGKRAVPRSILKIELADGTQLYPVPPQTAPAPPQVGQAISPEAAYMITSVLIDNQARGADFNYDNPLTLDDPRVPADNLNFPAIAAKTGTAQGAVGPTDIVTMGYSPYMAVGVWVGNADGSEMKPGIIGIAGAGYIFHDIMAWAVKNYHWPTSSAFAIPSDLTQGIFNCTTGLAPYKGETVHECPYHPYRPGSTNLYAGYGGARGASAAAHLDEDWYIKGQAWLQS